ncbi:GTPase HflX [Clostridium acetireducens DSM 10703]|uniref:GTPase HflX n=1 Tax=Clostridium acetireducens DSM 10703 TaxID=1121290 RepID=A0A1E8EWG3_9CLOT|nr:GTPase HflX [Clostridium acetireducens]OFI04954.1 GTPase HflX [Clostridium acetireducens DSM 10703]
MIFGNIHGIKKSIINKLESIYDISIDKDQLISKEIVDIIWEVTLTLNKEISVAIDRKGKVVSISIGDSNTVELPFIDVKEKGLSGIRIIHTHPNGNPNLSSIDISALIKLRLDCIAAIGVNVEGVSGVVLGFCYVKDNNIVSKLTNKITLEEALKYDLISTIKESEKVLKQVELKEDNVEKAILVGVENLESLEELKELAKACEVKVLHKVLQKREKIDSVFYIGKGKVEEIALLRQYYGANVIIFDDELSASQVRNLEEYIGCKIIDRTTLILEIFSARAKSREGKIQVELAQLKYRLPRLSGLGVVLSRTGGGIGTRGPGEKKLEIDKRHIKERIYDLTKELEKIRKNRVVQRRNRSDMQNISLVGYTNAGKSTLRNKLCYMAAAKEYSNKEKVFEADMLFATLDTTTRAICLPDNRTVALTDTVGFIRKLPHDLVEAFKSTLEEVIYSDLLLHVVDVSSLECIKHIKAVEKVLNELNVKNKSSILVLNKIDKAYEENILNVKEMYKDKIIIEISAKEEKNLDLLLLKIAQSLPQVLKVIKVLIPYKEQSMVAFLYRNSKIQKEEYKENGTYIETLVDNEVYNKCKNYIFNE